MIRVMREYDCTVRVLSTGTVLVGSRNGPQLVRELLCITASCMQNERGRGSRGRRGVFDEHRHEETAVKLKACAPPNPRGSVLSRMRGGGPSVGGAAAAALRVAP